MGKIREIIANLYQIDLEREPRFTYWLVTVLRFLNELRNQFIKDTVIVRASGMAYTTLLAIVPLVVVFFSVFTAFERFGEYREQIQQWIFSQVIPARTDELLAYINTFAANTKALGVLSTIVLFITAILLFDNIETNINALWKVEKRRSFIKRFMTFTNVLFWGPILIALSFYASGKIRAFAEANPLLGISILQRFFLGIFPWLFSVFAFFFMLMVIPNTRVKWRSALLGGAIGATIWELAKVGFTHTTARSLTYNAIYGSLAVVPIFLVWLYLTWIIVLLSVEISYVDHNFHALVLHRAFAKPSARERHHLAVRLFLTVAQAFYENREPPTIDELEERFNIPSEIAAEIAAHLLEVDLLRTTDLENDRIGYLPSRSLDQMKFGNVAAAIYQNSELAEPEKGLDEFDTLIGAILVEGEKAAGQVYNRMTVLDLVSAKGSLKEKA
ncbi:MAG: YihY family inner membrane protein [Myxococcales bacterium]|nr:YihY family inner membrane protein [Myxococcales bacterium]